jgi:hypothetical protein
VAASLAGADSVGNSRSYTFALQQRALRYADFANVFVLLFNACLTAEGVVYFQF